MTTARHTAPPSGVNGDSTTTTTTSEHSVRPSEYLRQWKSSPSSNPSPAEGTESETAPSPTRSPFEGDPKIFFAMAQPSGVTEAGLIASLKEKVGATHVEIEDMSGKPPWTSRNYPAAARAALNYHYPAKLPNLTSLVASIHGYMLTKIIGGCGQAFSAIIVSPQFEKKTTLARHRMVNTALKAEVAAIQIGRAHV